MQVGGPSYIWLKCSLTKYKIEIASFMFVSNESWFWSFVACHKMFNHMTHFPRKCKIVKMKMWLAYLVQVCLYRNDGSDCILHTHRIAGPLWCSERTFHFDNIIVDCIIGVICICAERLQTFWMLFVCSMHNAHIEIRDPNRLLWGMLHSIGCDACDMHVMPVSSLVFQILLVDTVSTRTPNTLTHWKSVSLTNKIHDKTLFLSVSFDLQLLHNPWAHTTMINVEELWAFSFKHHHQLKSLQIN